MLTVWLSSEQQKEGPILWRKIADNCLENFLQEQPEKCPPLYQSSQLFGSPIFEYGNPRQPGEYGHILVWLFLGEDANGKYYAKAEENFCFFDQEFIDLFIYRQKVINTYQISRQVYADVRQAYQQIKEIIQEIEAKLPGDNQSTQNQGLSDEEMRDFQDKLRTLPKLALKYGDGLRDLENRRITIEVNANNYEVKLRQIQEKEPNEEVSFLSVFSEKICRTFQEQINVDLGYFRYSSGLVDKAIASIRGIVEIEQAQRDRQLQEREQQRDRQLQITILAVGAGVSAGGIFASSYTLITPENPLLLPGQDRTIHPFTLSVICSLLFSFLFGIAIYAAIQGIAKLRKVKGDW
ncbi:MAG: hypothetical protein AB4426_12900 [Xenococcaceae cyanobacterium]